VPILPLLSRQQLLDALDATVKAVASIDERRQLFGSEKVADGAGRYSAKSAKRLKNRTFQSEMNTL
ncbi:MAG: hypothetical protein WC810_23350, partial [Janthinobacterium sp.]